MGNVLVAKSKENINSSNDSNWIWQQKGELFKIHDQDEERPTSNLIKYLKTQLTIRSLPNKIHNLKLSISPKHFKIYKHE